MSARGRYAGLPLQTQTFQEIFEVKKAIFGALLSGLVYPGVGQIALKYTKRGVFFIVITTLSLLWLVLIAVQKALLILDHLQMENRIIDYHTIHEATEKSLASADSTLFKAALVLLLLSWLVSIWDAYRLGKQIDKHMEAEKPFEL